MWSSAAKALLLAGVAALLAAIPASSQDRSRPESLLPPGFGDPKSLPPRTTGSAAAAPAARAAEPEGRGQYRRTGAGAGRERRRGRGKRAVEEVPLDTAALPRPSNYFTVPQEARAPPTWSARSPGQFRLGSRGVRLEPALALLRGH